MELDPAATFKQAAQAVTFTLLMKYLLGGKIVGITKMELTENMLLFLFLLSSYQEACGWMM